MQGVETLAKIATKAAEIAFSTSTRGGASRNTAVAAAARRLRLFLQDLRPRPVRGVFARPHQRKNGLMEPIYRLVVVGWHRGHAGYQ